MAVVIGTGDLCTVEDVRVYSLRDAADDALDSLWEILIPGCSQACSIWAGRQFTSEDDATHHFAVPPTGLVGFIPLELRVETEVLLDGNATTYELGPVGGTRQGTYRSLSIPTLGDMVTVSGDWGMAEVPPLARQACLVAIDAYYQNSAGHGSEQLGGHSFSESAFGPSGLPEAARSLLNHFRGVSIS